MENEELGKLVHELRDSVEQKGFVDKDKVGRLNTILDEYEQKGQEITLIEQAAKNLEVDVAELKTANEQFKEEQGKSAEHAAELKGLIEGLEAEIARGITIQTKADPNAYLEMPEYKSLNQWCIEGDRIFLQEEHKALLRTDSATEGGILAPTELDTVIVKRITEIDQFRAAARVRAITSKSLEMAIRTGIPTSTYEGEAEEGGESTTTYDSVTVTPYRQTNTVPVTKDMLMDAAFDMESEIMSDSAEAFAFTEGKWFVKGDGHKKPQGFTTHAGVQALARVGISNGSVIDPGDLIKLTGDLKVGYNPSYTLNRRSLAFIRTLRDTNGQFLWSPGMNGPVANTLNGFPYMIMDSMPDMADNAYSVGFGDWRRGYSIVDRMALSVVRDELAQKKKAIVEFTMLRWNTGLVTLTEAIKLLQLTA